MCRDTADLSMEKQLSRATPDEPAAAWHHAAGKHVDVDAGATSGDVSRDLPADPNLQPRPRPVADDLRKEFKLVAKQTSEPAAPKPARTKQRSGGDKGLTVSVLVASYLRLCHDPCKDVIRWIEEDKRRPASVSTTAAQQATDHVETPPRTPPTLEDAGRLCARALHQMQGGLDQDRQPGWSADDLSARSRAGAGGDDQLRSLRAEGRQHLAGDAPDGSGEFASELGALDGYFASRRAAIRSSSRPGERAALLRALANEQVVAKRAVMSRWQAARREAHSRRQLPPSEAPMVSGMLPIRPSVGGSCCG